MEEERGLGGQRDEVVGSREKGKLWRGLGEIGGLRRGRGEMEMIESRG